MSESIRPSEQDVVFKGSVEPKKGFFANLFGKNEKPKSGDGETETVKHAFSADIRQKTPEEIEARKEEDRKFDAKTASEKATKERLEKEEQRVQQLKDARERIANRNQPTESKESETTDTGTKISPEIPVED